MTILTPSSRTPDQTAGWLAKRQYGYLTHRDALRCGLTDHQIADRLARRGWSSPARGLYQLPGAGTVTWRHAAMAACLLGGDGALASHITAVALHSMSRASTLPHITVPRSSSVRTPLARVHRSDVPRLDRTWVDGIPCTTASRALVDAAALVDRATLDEMVDQGFCSGRASPESVRAALARAGRMGRHGATLLLRAIEIWDQDIEPGSPAEMRFLRRLEEWGVSGAVTQHEVYDADGVLVAILDVALIPRLHGFEYDSDRYHNPRRFGPDEDRHARLKALGWRIDHVSKRDLLPSATRIAELLAQRRVA